MIKPNEVRAKALKLEDQNIKFRTFLKNRADYDELDAQFLRLHKELFADYDCCQCANCCRMCKILLDDNDVKRISAVLEMPEDDFIEKYLSDADNDDEKPYKITAEPCAFLENDGRCRIQRYKPDGCREFPFTDHPDRLASMYSVIGHAEICPIVFEILERLKEIYGFRKRR